MSGFYIYLELWLHIKISFQSFDNHGHMSRLAILIFFENRGYALSRIILNIVGYHVTFLRTTHTLVAKLDLILDVMPPS